MKTLFSLTTDRIRLTWQQVDGDRPVRFDAGTRPPRFRVVALGAAAESTLRIDPSELAAQPPRLFEHTRYKLYLRGLDGRSVSISHRDPRIRQMLASEQDGDVVAGVISFRGEIGHTVFTVIVDGEPALRLELEVFPTKLDYRADYESMLAEIQDLAAGLAMQHLASTQQEGAVTTYTRPTRLEWLTQLQRVEAKLDRAMRHINEHPRRGMVRRDEPVRADRIKRIDSSVRRAVRQRRGHGALRYTRNRTPIYEWLPASTPRPTLDTPEHRWLASRLDAVRRRLATLRNQEAALTANPRREQTIATLDALGRSAVRWRSIEPLAEVDGPPPQGFASVQLFAAPGYREAALACLELNKGIRIGGRALSLSVRQLSELYEYWCYLTLVRCVAEILDRPIPADQLMITQYHGIHLRLNQGRSQSVVFSDRGARRVTLTYNPLYRNAEAILIPQRPDMQITIEEPGWPKLHLILDAKYRLTLDDRYVEQFGSPGPPTDAINAMHRYRDAVLEMDGLDDDRAGHRRSVVQAAAVFPYRDHEGEPTFESGRLWRALEKIGVGAVPLLPESEDYLKAFLATGLNRGGWATADATIDHAGVRRAGRWRDAAAQRVLVVMLPREDPDEALRLLQTERTCAMPLLKHPRLQLGARRIAFYRPGDDDTLGVVGWSALVSDAGIVRDAAGTLTFGNTAGHEGLWARFDLGALAPLNRSVSATPQALSLESLGQHRWTTVLALERAQTVSELLLETEADWRLYETLKAAGIAFSLQPRSAPAPATPDGSGRARFLLGRWSIHHNGAAGYCIEDASGQRQFAATTDRVLGVIQAADGTATDAR